MRARLIKFEDKKLTPKPRLRIISKITELSIV